MFKEKLMWVDIETTGLDENKDSILEIAMAVTDKELNEIDRISIIILQKYSKIRFSTYAARKMHEKNGLLRELSLFENFEPFMSSLHYLIVRLKDAEVILSEWIERNKFQNLRIAGSNPDFDRRFIKVHMPKVYKLFHYRNFDMNTIYYYEGIDKDKLPPSNHRALDDIRRDIRQLKKIKGVK